uniref:Uncharacterized protein n=1 Tax=Opuntia streptacantha TaxID=393608 RepID=A0A7C9E2F7_OPUST
MYIQSKDTITNNIEACYVSNSDHPKNNKDYFFYQKQPCKFTSNTYAMASTGRNFLLNFAALEQRFCNTNASVAVHIMLAANRHISLGTTNQLCSGVLGLP